MSCRPLAIRRHRSKKGDRAALVQWRNRMRRNPFEAAKLSIEDAMVAILAANGEPVSFERMKAQLLLLAEAGAISCPKPSRKEMQAAIAEWRKAG